MSDGVRIISPVDGSVYAERPFASEAAIDEAVSAARAFATLDLELGGKDPAYVMADANLDHAIEKLVDGAFFNSGQCCCGIVRMYVDASVHDAFVDGVAAMAKQYVVGNPFDAETTMGPMSRAGFADTVRTQTAQALATGATPLVGMKVDGDQEGSPYLAPEVLVDVDHDMTVMREESFGPSAAS